MLLLPDTPSLPRKILLAPLALAYAAGASLHRRLWLRPRFPVPALPLIVLGSLRAGGGGKTAVTLELARRLAARGKRVGILAYRIRGTEDLEVAPTSDWRESSDEAVLLARRSGARVFATRDRVALWKRLDGTDEFDVLLSDDGLMDARLAGAFRVALIRPGERPGLLDLLPAGPYRLTAAALKSMDHVLPFSRALVFPDDFDFAKSYRVLCGMGNPAAFRQDLELAGVKVAGLLAGPDHGLPEGDAERWRRSPDGAPGFLFSAKDGVKLAGLLGMGAPAVEIGERVALPASFLSALDVFLAVPSS
jgi:tetraacyldisaccharide-1-P 4'-kinase